MGKYRIEGLTDFLNKEDNIELKHRTLFKWIDEDVININEYLELVKLILHNVSINEERVALCANCNGEGGFQFSQNPDDCELCGCCNGTGIVEGEHYDDLQGCMTCNGRGTL